MKQTCSRLAALTLGLFLCACGDNAPSAAHPGGAGGTTHSSARVVATAADYRPLLQQLYVGYFGRPGDPAGIDFYSQRYLEAQAPTDIHALFAAYQSKPAVKALVDSFGTSDESQQLYPGDNRAFIRAIYRNVFSRDADSVGLDYWARLIDQGAVTRPIAVVAIMAGSIDSDVTIINNKRAVADSFSLALAAPLYGNSYDGMLANASARAMLAKVGLGTSVDAFQPSVEATLNSIATQNPKPGVYFLAGSAGGSGNIDGSGSAARLFMPGNGTIAADHHGNVYVTSPDSQTVRKITQAGVVTTFVGRPLQAGSTLGQGGAARLSYPNVLAIDGNDNLLLGQDGMVLKITPAGVVSSFAGSSNRGNQDGRAADATFGQVSGLAVDAGGNVYVSDGNNGQIRKIGTDGIVSTVAGSQEHFLDYRDGVGKDAYFSGPMGLVVAPSGNLFVCDGGNNAIRMIDRSGRVTTIAGGKGAGSADGIGAAATFNGPIAIAIDASGALIVVDGAGTSVRKITDPASGAAKVSTILQPSMDQVQRDGPLASASLERVAGIAIDSSGNIALSDRDTVRRIDRAGMLTTLAGLADQRGSVDGVGAAARFAGWSSSAAFTSDSAGNLYLADTDNATIRKISPFGVTTTIAGQAGVQSTVNGPLASATLDYPNAIARSADGTLYVTAFNMVRKIANGQISTLAGQVGPRGRTDGPGESATFEDLTHMGIDGQGNIYVADHRSEHNNFAIRKITPAGMVSTLADFIPGHPYDLAVSPGGLVYFSTTFDPGVSRLNAAGAVLPVDISDADGFLFGSKAGLRDEVRALSVDSSGNLYILGKSSVLYKTSPSGIATAIAGNPLQPGPVVYQSLPGALPVGGKMHVTGPKTIVVSTATGVFQVKLP